MTCDPVCPIRISKGHKKAHHEFDNTRDLMSDFAVQKRPERAVFGHHKALRGQIA